MKPINSPDVTERSESPNSDSLQRVVSCSDIQWLIAVEYFTDPNCKNIRDKAEQAAQAIEECQAAHLGDECDICRASG